MKVHYLSQCIRAMTAAMLGIGALVAGNWAHAQTEKVLNVYNWAEYIGDNTVKEFEANF